MAPTITATPGASDANSYLTLLEADAIADTMLGPLSWSTATSDNKTRALITATNGLETLEWIGTRTSTTQSLSWPRTNASCGDKAPSDTEIPREVQLACFDLANALLDTPTLLRNSPSTESLVNGIPNRDLKRLKLDVMEIEWRQDIKNSTTTPTTPLTVLPHLTTILGCLTTTVTRNGKSWAAPVVRS